jgi:hypothetical protein
MSLNEIENNNVSHNNYVMSNNFNINNNNNKNNVIHINQNNNNNSNNNNNNNNIVSNHPSVNSTNQKYSEGTNKRFTFAINNEALEQANLQRKEKMTKLEGVKSYKNLYNFSMNSIQNNSISQSKSNLVKNKSTIKINSSLQSSQSNLRGENSVRLNINEINEVNDSNRKDSALTKNKSHITFKNFNIKKENQDSKFKL